MDGYPLKLNKAFRNTNNKNQSATRRDKDG
jgi:hypothetical protein